MKIILSLSFVIVTAFLTHHFYISRLGQPDENRNLAAFSERNTEQQIKWEQNVAQELSNSKEHVQVAVKPSWQDRLSYEFLQGKYDIVSTDGQIQKLILQSAQSGVIFDSKDFMNQFGPQIKLYDSYQISKNSDQLDTINLYDKSGQPLGALEIKRNEKGFVTEVLIK